MLLVTEMALVVVEKRNFEKGCRFLAKKLNELIRGSEGKGEWRGGGSIGSG